ncbi:hypothetical protein PINS_up020796 [Pythium insidiosum]|nr:hypothetical protein PINS_up012923 [Pythium insidiosum]GLE09205.1 hypothetical protein PINS_up020796 [Pythium insidiosum]
MKRCHSSPSVRNAKLASHRVTIYFQDDAVRQRSEVNAHRLLQDASCDKPVSTNAILAQKALRYRKHLSRMALTDVTLPGFDASKFLGVDWRKTHSLEAHCRRH